MVWLFYTTYISVDIAHYEIFHAKVGKGGIKEVTALMTDHHKNKYKRVVKCLILDQEAAGSSLTGVTSLCP